MAFMIVALLLLSSFLERVSCDVVQRKSNLDQPPENPGAVFRYGDFGTLTGRHIVARADDCGCREGEKCCTSPEGATFCIPESATCCGRTWCNGELETCCRDSPHGGCCPKDTECAIGGKGCCKKDRPCFGPYTCYDNQSIECRNGTVDAFQCCPVSAPNCLFDPQNGYGCFVGTEIPSYSMSVMSLPTDIVKVPTDSSAGTASAGATSIGSESVTTTPEGLDPTGVPNTSSGVVSGLESPSIGTWNSNGNSGSSSFTARTTTTTRRNITSEAPTTTADMATAAAPAKAGSGYGFFKQVGVAGLALLVMG